MALAVTDAQVGAWSILQTRGTTEVYELDAVDDTGDTVDLSGYTFTGTLNGVALDPAPEYVDGAWQVTVVAPDRTVRWVLELFADGQLATIGVADFTDQGTATPTDETTLRLLDPIPVTVIVRLAATASPGDGGAGSYVHTQASPSASWLIVHNLGFYPNVTLQIGGQAADGDVAHNSTNSLTITHGSPLAGTAYLS